MKCVVEEGVHVRVVCLGDAPEDVKDGRALRAFIGERSDLLVIVEDRHGILRKLHAVCDRVRHREIVESRREKIVSHLHGSLEIVEKEIRAENALGARPEFFGNAFAKRRVSGVHGKFF